MGTFSVTTGALSYAAMLEPNNTQSQFSLQLKRDDGVAMGFKYIQQQQTGEWK